MLIVRFMKKTMLTSASSKYFDVFCVRIKKENRKERE